MASSRAHSMHTFSLIALVIAATVVRVAPGRDG
jgi:hypothetical protein